MFTFFPRILVSWETQTCSHWSTAVVSVRGSGQNWCRGKNVVMFMVPILILLTREILSHHPLLPPPYFFLYWKMSGRFFFWCEVQIFPNDFRVPSLLPFQKRCCFRHCPHFLNHNYTTVCFYASYTYVLWEFISFFVDFYWSFFLNFQISL